MGVFSSSYETDVGLQKHLQSGSHVFRLHRESKFDYIKGQYLNMVKRGTVNATFWREF